MIVAFKGTVADLPFPVLVAYQTAVYLVFHRQTSEFVRRNRVDKIADPAFKNDRAFLPVTFNKVGPVKR
ncbi:Uncharacterised protein [Enterobacter cloacae]|nr:Uncharacterised protein [Enterobacter cloacae]